MSGSTGNCFKDSSSQSRVKKNHLFEEKDKDIPSSQKKANYRT